MNFALALQGKGYCLSKLGRYEDALKFFKEFTEINPDDAFVRETMGYIFFVNLNKYEELIIQFNKSLLRSLLPMLTHGIIERVLR